MEVVSSGQILDIYLKVKLIEFSDGFDNEVWEKEGSQRWLQGFWPTKE